MAVNTSVYFMYIYVFINNDSSVVTFAAYCRHSMGPFCSLYEAGQEVDL